MPGPDRRVGVIQALAGHLDEYAGHPADVISLVISRAIREFATAGGDLENMRISVLRANFDAPGLSKVEIRVEGWTTS